jgi:hypothetical protein
MCTFRFIIQKKKFVKLQNITLPIRNQNIIILKYIEEGFVSTSINQCILPSFRFI